ncbi:uncharacterized protein LOC143057299 isoform X2 [Mytilus galloprovincialis]
MKELLITVLLACLSNVNAENQGVYITQKWPGGFHGYFILRPDHTLHGWNATLTLSADVDKLTIWAADIVSSSSGNTFVIKNKGFSADVAKNDEIKIEFQGDKRGMSNPPSGTISIGGAGALGTGGNTGGGGTGTGSGSNIGGGPSVPPYTGQGQSQMKHDYSKAMTLSILFFDAQRSGRLSGTNNPIPWRGDSALGDNGDGHDLSGGWYDAGDHVKFNLPMSYSAHVLGWGLQKFKDAYQRAGQLDMMYDMLKWPLDYFLKCWEPNKQTYWVQVGDGHADHGFWGRPEDMHMGRPAFKITPGNPGSDVAGNTASAFAIGAIVFKDKDAGYAGRLLDAAKSIYQFAKSHPGIYSNSVPQSKDFYGSNGWKDEMCEAAAELFKATGDQQYLNDAKQWFSGGTAWGYSWDDKTVGCQLLLWEATQDNQYKAPVEAFVNSYKPGGGVPYTPCGLVYRDKWGSNRYAGNAAFIAVMAAADGIGGADYLKWAMTQINYILGDNNLHISYEIGFGGYFPHKPHHRGASCKPGWCAPENQNSPNQLNGALVGGPGQNDDYSDNRGDYVKNEVACDYNAGFQGACAGLYHFAINNQLPPSPPSKC